MAPVTTALVARLVTSGTSPLSSEVWSSTMRNAPIARPAPTAIASPRALGRTIFSPGMKPTSTTATSATPSPTYPMGASASPFTSSPHSIGATADTTAVSGDRMLIGPIARHAYRSAIATTLKMPPSTPHATSGADHTPPNSGWATSRAASPESAATAVTTIDRKRRAARPPRKSAEPYTMAPTRAMAAEIIATQLRSAARAGLRSGCQVVEEDSIR